MRIDITGFADVPEDEQQGVGHAILLVLYYMGYMKDGVEVEFSA